MKRYHKKVYFPDNAQERLRRFIDKLNKIKIWGYSKHSISNLKYRVHNIKDILLYIKTLQLDYNDIFEYYEENTKIKKAVFKIDYQGIFDLCIVISEIKNIITIYINSKGDNHATLNKRLYVSN